VKLCVIIKLGDKMKFKIFKIEDSGYHISLSRCDTIFNGTITFDCNIASHLGLTLEEYHNVLKMHNAYAVGVKYPDPMYNFKSQEDAERVIEELEPYLIMEQLIGE